MNAIFIIMFWLVEINITNLVFLSLQNLTSPFQTVNDLMFISGWPHLEDNTCLTTTNSIDYLLELILGYI